MLKNEEFEEILDHFVSAAADLSSNGFDLIDAHLPDGFSRDQMPHSTVYRLHVVATSTFRSGLICLRSPETALTTLGLLRGLLEAWSHLEFISNSSYGGDPTCRALRFERGTHKEWGYAIGRAADPEIDGLRLAHEEHLRALEQIWTDHGCKGPDRSQGNAEETITKKLAKLQHMEWLPQMWKVTSASLHMLGSDYLFESSDGESRLVWSSNAYRVLWFRFTVATYVYLTWTAASILGADVSAIQPFRDAGEKILMNPVLLGLFSPSGK